MFEVTQSYPIPRRSLKKVFDKAKADLLSDLYSEPNYSEKVIAAARALNFDKFLKELHSDFSSAVEMDEVQPKDIPDVEAWAESEFESWAVQP